MKAGNSEPQPSRTTQKAANPLQRGSACLSCRKRKMKCDATKPVCRQCVRANRPGECEYDDGRLKSRTQILQEKIAKLEARIRELEASPDASLSSASSSASSSSLQLSLSELASSAELLDGALGCSPQSMFAPSLTGSPHSAYGMSPPGELAGDGASSSGSQSAAWAAAAAVAEPYLMPAAQDFQGVLSSDFMPSLELEGDGLYMQGGIPWWAAEDLAPTDRDMLLDIFLPHSKQCGFEVHVERLRASLESSSDLPHAALLNAMYLLACHFSQSPALQEHEPHFLARALRGISVALEHSDRLVNIVQASGLLAVYFFAKARLLEGYYHSSSAARLAVALGLHQIRTPVWRPQEALASPSATWNGSPGSFVPLAPPQHSVELGERILAFWQVFIVDRCWSVATGLPSSLPDDDHPQLHISTVWPRTIYDYESGNDVNVDYSSLEAVYDCRAPAYPAYDCMQSLRGKAATFFERASRIAAMRAEASQWEQVCQTEFALARFAATLPPLRPAAAPAAPGGPGRLDAELVVVHTLAAVSAIQLHHPFAQKELAAHDKCLAAARTATAIIRQLSEFDFPYLDPVIGTCWMCASDVFIRDQMYAGAEPAACGAYSAAEELDTVVGALKQLSNTFPLALYQAEKIEQSRAMSY